MNILLVGGAGYLGSHTALSLIENGHDVVIVDNYDNSSPEAVKRVEELAGKPIVHYETDVQDRDAMMKIFKSNPIDCVIHRAGLKAFSESVQKLVLYEIGPRWADDLPQFWANADKAKDILSWTAQRDLKDMCRDSWNW